METSKPKVVETKVFQSAGSKACLAMGEEWISSNEDEP